MKVLKRVHDKKIVYVCHLEEIWWKKLFYM